MNQWLAVVLAVASALCLAVGTQQQGAAVADRVPGRLSPRALPALLRSPRWLLGLGLLGAGTALNVTALGLATVTVVQPIGVVALVVTTLLHARHRRLRINRRTWAAIGMCTAGGAVFVTCAVSATDPARAISRWAEHTVVLALVVLVCVLGTAALLFRGSLGGTFYVVGAGILYGFVAVLVRLTLTRIQGSTGGPLDDVNWAAVGVGAAAAVLGGWFVQSAFAGGPPDVVIAGLTVLDPMVGVLLGMLVLGEAADGFSVATGVLMAAAGAVAIVGVAVLSQHHPEVLARRAAPAGPRPPAPGAPAADPAAPDRAALHRPGSHA
ncbi:DMT family transporter [Kocuria flava]|uniref:DMT family transporter n=1 Tax=Kocuria flava TaxID=446860 RepID=UPI0015E04267|nr:DMT family transporter [Kocuria flava]